MGYLKEFLTQIDNRDFHKFLILWEEYCTSDSVDPEEIKQLLRVIKSSDMAKQFGQLVETAIPLWRTIQDKSESYEVLRLLIDLETNNSSDLGDITLEAIKDKYGQDPKFNDRLRLIGLRNKDNFQGAISKYDLLVHMIKGNIVFHTGGWGTGEIIEVSLVREHLIIDFENVAGRKDFSFANAFKNLIPLPPTHFLARRFTNPDQLEEDGRKDPIFLIKLLLKDLGPKTAAEIKDELCELVIPEGDWTKWWQGTRAKIKKDPMIESPESLKDEFRLRKVQQSVEEKLHSSIKNKTNSIDILQSTYNFARDNAAALKDPAMKQKLQDKITALIQDPALPADQMLQAHLLLEQFFNYRSKENPISAQIQEPSAEIIEDTINRIEILAFKKRAMVAVKEFREDWDKIFLSLLFTIPQAQLRDYLLKELNQGEYRKELTKRLTDLLNKPQSYPEMFVWYFQKLVSQEDADIPYSNKEGQCLFFESFFILYNYLENQPEYRELIKKMYNLIAGKRYALVRQILQGTDIEYINEFLLLTTKCQSLTDHDKKILRSLAEVVHPSLVPPKQRKGSAQNEDNEIIWTTEEGYLKTQDRIRQIGTVEMIENAREIEAARALGDLRENSEFKFAQERRARLQSEITTLSDQLKRARVITDQDIQNDEVGIGSIVELADQKGNTLRYSILGPWDANPEENILSFHSKLAQAMLGRKKNESFEFKEENFKITSLTNFFDK